MRRAHGIAGGLVLLAATLATTLAATCLLDSADTGPGGRPYPPPAAGGPRPASRTRPRASAPGDAVAASGDVAPSAAPDTSPCRNTVPPHRGGWLTGRVVGPDGAPLHRARVTCHPDPIGYAGGSQSTEEDGTFGDPVNTPVGVVRTIAWDDGFAVEIGPWHTFRPGDDLDVGTIRLAPAAAISGTVVGPEGDPRPGAVVRVLSTDAIPFEDWRLVEEWTWLDEPDADRETGEFRLDSFPPGTYRLRAESADGAARSDEVTVVAPTSGIRLVLPNTSPTADVRPPADPFAPDPDHETADGDARPRIAATWDCDRAAGRARRAEPDEPPPPDERGADVSTRTFTFDFDDPAPTTWYATYAVHEVVEGAPPAWRMNGVGYADEIVFATREARGTYRLVVSVEADGVAFRTVVLEGWTPDGTTTALPMRAAPCVSGRVVRADGTPVIGAKIDATWDDVEASRRLWTDLEGRFTLTGLDVATWRVEVTTPGLAATIALDVPESGIEDARLVVARDR